MAIIYSYPITTPENPDLFIISRNPSDPDEISNFSITTDALANFITARVNLDFTGDTGTGIVNLDTQTLSIIGTSNEIETTANAQALQIGLPDDVVITNNLTVGNDVQIDTLTDNYIPVNNNSGILRDSGFYQVSAPSTADRAIGLNTTLLDSFYGEYPDLRIASRSLNDPGVLDLFRPDGDVQAGDRVGILQYSLNDDAQYAVAQIEVKTIGNSGTGNTGGGKLCIKTSSNQPGAQVAERLCIDNTEANFSVPVNVTSTVQSSFAGQVTIPTTPIADTDAASKAYVDSQSAGQVTGTGSTNVLPKWTDGGNSVLGNSNILDNGEKIIIPGLYGLTVGNNQLPYSAFNGVVFGENNTIAGKYSFASGQQNTAGVAQDVANDATALGYGNTASGMQALATGANTTASGAEAASFGNATTASGGRAIATGFETTASGLNALSLGNTTTASGDNSIAAGFNNTSSENNSFALGANLLNSNESSLVVGEWNADNAGLVFSAGAGFASNLRNNVFEVYKDGTFNIGDLSGFNSKAKITSVNGVIDIVSSDINNSEVTMAKLSGSAPISFIKLGGTGAANTLDDYEEGIFTPNINSYIGGTLSPVYATQEGSYTKIGNVCIAKFNLVLASTTTFSGTGILIFGSLPFPIKSPGGPGSSSIQCSISQANRLQNTEFFVGANQGPGGDLTIALQRQGTPTGHDQTINFTTADLQSGGNITLRFSITYITT